MGDAATAFTTRGSNFAKYFVQTTLYSVLAYYLSWVRHLSGSVQDGACCVLRIKQLGHSLDSTAAALSQVVHRVPNLLAVCEARSARWHNLIDYITMFVRA